MGDGADDARYAEECRQEEEWAHRMGKCGGATECSICYAMELWPEEEVEVDKKKVVKEQLQYSNYEIMELTPSRIDPGINIYGSGGFQCPHCKHEFKNPIPHGGTRSCRCGLRMKRSGTTLYCEIEEEKLNDRRVVRGKK